jgi:hypothetical protein
MALVRRVRKDAPGLGFVGHVAPFSHSCAARETGAKKGQKVPKGAIGDHPDGALPPEITFSVRFGAVWCGLVRLSGFFTAGKP